MAAATQTKTITTRSVNAARTFDHVYDPTYTVSGAPDFARATTRANVEGSRVVPMPDANNMFSALVHVPRGTVVLRQAGPSGAAATADFAAKQQQQRTLVLQHRATSEPAGRDYAAKFFSRARIAQSSSGSHQNTALLKLTRESPAPPKPVVAEATTRTIAIQTDYRENETQTDPWTPDYIVRPGSAPEVLTLATLSYGHGLPAGLAEVEMIERARAKRAWEATLPAVEDVEHMDERLRMMEEREMEEWKLREQEIERLQAQRLSILEQQLAQRSQEHARANSMRLEALHQTRQRERGASLQRAQRDTLVELRRIARQREAVEPSVTRRDIVADYADPSSDVFAPVARDGGFSIDNIPADLRVRSRYLSTYQGLLELEASLPVSLTQPRVSVPQRAQNTKLMGSTARAAAKLQETLRGVHLSQTIKAPPPSAPAPLRFCEEIVPPPVRPSTPSVDMPSAEEEEKEQAAILIQRLLRGRAAQNEMFVGREQRRELIAELRSTHALQEAEQQAKAAQRDRVLSQQKEVAEKEHERRVKEDAILDVQAEQVGDTLGFLSKELVRLQEQRRIHAFAMLAERNRRMREAEESGKRQIEETRRRRNDEVFRQVVGVHLESVDTYLEEIVLEARVAVADQQAREEVRRQAAIIDEVSAAAHASGYDTTAEGAEAIVADLVAGFLLPEVQRQARREQVQRHQRRFVEAAHAELLAETQKVEADAPEVPRPRRSRGGSRPTSVASTRPTSVSVAGARRPPSGVGQRATSAKALDTNLTTLGEN